MKNLQHEKIDFDIFFDHKLTIGFIELTEVLLNKKNKDNVRLL